MLRLGERVTKGSAVNVAVQLVHLAENHPLTYKALVEAARKHPLPADLHLNSLEILSKRNLMATTAEVQREARLVIIAAVVDVIDDGGEDGLALQNPVAQDDPFYEEMQALLGRHFEK